MHNNNCGNNNNNGSSNNDTIDVAPTTIEAAPAGP